MQDSPVCSLDVYITGSVSRDARSYNGLIYMNIYEAITAIKTLVNIINSILILMMHFSH